jgi:hypothetical protein
VEGCTFELDFLSLENRKLKMKGLFRKDASFAMGNQLIGVTCALLDIRGWAPARYVLNMLEEKGVNILTLIGIYRDLKTAILGLVDWQTAELYDAYGFVSLGLSSAPRSAKELDAKRKVVMWKGEQLQPLACIETFPQDVLPIISYVGYHIGESTLLSTRLCRLLKAHIEFHLKKSIVSFGAEVRTDTSGEQVDSPVESLQPLVVILAHSILPGLSVRRGSNPCLASQIFSAMALLPFTVRFSIYELWRGLRTGKDGVGTKPLEVSLAETKVPYILFTL